MRHLKTMMAACLATSLGGAAMAQQAATAEVLTADGAAAGTVTLQALAAGVLVSADLSGLPPGEHGIHIHESGACTPDFTAAGGHLATGGGEHGFAATEDPHEGDLPNIVVSEDGNAAARFLNWRVTMAEILDEDGSSIMIHAGPDNYSDMSSSGDRIACGVVEAQD